MLSDRREPFEHEILPSVVNIQPTGLSWETCIHGVYHRIWMVTAKVAFRKAGDIRARDNAASRCHPITREWVSKLVQRRRLEPCAIGLNW